MRGQRHRSRPVRQPSPRRKAAGALRRLQPSLARRFRQWDLRWPHELPKYTRPRTCYFGKELELKARVDPLIWQPKMRCLLNCSLAEGQIPAPGQRIRMMQKHSVHLILQGCLLFASHAPSSRTHDLQHGEDGRAVVLGQTLWGAELLVARVVKGGPSQLLRHHQARQVQAQMSMISHLLSTCVMPAPSQYVQSYEVSSGCWAPGLVGQECPSLTSDTRKTLEERARKCGRAHQVSPAVLRGSLLSGCQVRAVPKVRAKAAEATRHFATVA